MAATVEIKGGEELQRKLAEIASRLSTAKELRVGFLEGSPYRDGTSAPMVAAVQNWGKPGIPARPFFSKMVENNQAGWPALIEEGLKRFGMDAAQALAFTGQIMTEQLQDSIQDGDWVANSPVTNLLKWRFPQGGQSFEDVLQARRDVAAGASAPAGKPLIQSGDLSGAANFEVD